MGSILKRQHLGTGILVLALLMVVLSAQAQRRPRQPQVEADPNPMLMSLTRQAPAAFTAGSLFEVIVIINAGGEDILTAMGLYETVPSGWEFVSMRGISADPPPIAPGSGDSGVLQFAWINPPDLPYTFAYTLSIPPGESGLRILSGQIEYRTLGGRLVSAPEITETNGVDNTPPVIQLLGDNPLIIEAGSAFSEPGYQATDNVDGDVSASVQVQGVVDTSTVGTYRLSYTAVDSAGNRSQAVVRTVRVVAAGSGGGRGPSRPRNVYLPPGEWTGGGATRRDTPTGTEEAQPDTPAPETENAAGSAERIDPDQARNTALAERIARRGQESAGSPSTESSTVIEPGVVGDVVKRMTDSLADNESVSEAAPATADAPAVVAGDESPVAPTQEAVFPETSAGTDIRVARVPADATTLGTALAPLDAGGTRPSAFHLSAGQALGLLGVVALCAVLAAVAWRFAYSGPARKRNSRRQ